MKNSQQKYPLLPFAQFVYDSMRWMPWAFMYKIKLRTKAFSLEEAQDIARQIIDNHPVFQSRLDWRGRQYACNSKNQFQSPYFKLKMWQEGDWLYVQVAFNILLGDGYSIYILINDILRTCAGEKLEDDHYWNYVSRFEQRKKEPHYIASREWLISEFRDESVPVRPTIDKRWIHTWIPPKVGLYVEDYTDKQEKLSQFQHENVISYEGIFSLCVALAIAEYCGTDGAALTWAYSGRETEEEQHIFGSLHRDIPFQINHISNIRNQKSELIRHARKQVRSGIAHSDFPYTLIAPYNQRWNYAVNVLRVPDIEMLANNFPIPVELLSIPQQKFAYALLDVEIIENVGTLRLQFRYSATHYKSESIRKFAALVHKYVEWLID